MQASRSRATSECATMLWCNADKCLHWTTQAICMRLNYICKAASATNLCLDKIPKVLDLCQTMVCQHSPAVLVRWRARLTHRCERWSFPSSSVTLHATAAIRLQPSYYKINCTSVISISSKFEWSFAQPLPIYLWQSDRWFFPPKRLEQSAIQARVAWEIFTSQGAMTSLMTVM